MENRTKKIGIFSLLSLAGLAALPAQAICPVCTVLVTGGVGLSRYLGVDDAVSGLWVGGLTVSVIVWTLEWMERKKIDFKGKQLAVAAGYYALVLGSFYYANLISDPIRTICSCTTDKLFLGIVVGSLAFWMGASWYYYLKEKNGSKAYFPFQKVAMPLFPLVVLSIYFYLITK